MYSFFDLKTIKCYLFSFLFVFCSCEKNEDWGGIRAASGSHGFFIVLIDKEGNDLLDVSSPHRVKSITLRYDDNLPVCYVLKNLGKKENVHLWMYWRTNCEYSVEAGNLSSFEGGNIYSLEDRVENYTNYLSSSTELYPYNLYNVLFTLYHQDKDKDIESIYTFKTETRDGIISTDSIRVQHFAYKSKSGKIIHLAKKVYLNNELKWDFDSDGIFAGDWNTTLEDELKETPYIVLIK